MSTLFNILSAISSLDLLLILMLFSSYYGFLRLMKLSGALKKDRCPKCHGGLMRVRRKPGDILMSYATL